MAKFTRNANGKYVVNGTNYDMLIGTRAQVWHGTAYKTSGGLTKNDLFQNKSGRIVSKTKHMTAKKEMRLVKAGYGTQKGKFGYVKMGKKSKRSSRGGRGSRRMRGGNINIPLSPSDYDGRGVGTSGVALQMVAGNATS